jgi:Ca2+-binding RTX toxin-like protein
MPRLVFAAVAVAAALTAAPASAATVSVTASQPDIGNDALHYTAAPGETNDVRIATEGVLTYRGWIVNDATAPLTAGDGCTSLDAHTASCPLTDTEANLEVFVDLGDGDDLASVRDACGDGDGGEDFACHDPVVHGGPGDDVLVGTGVVIGTSTIGSRLYGGSGDDLVTAGDGPSTLSGGRGDDTVEGSRYADVLYGNAGADLVRGGDGRDRVWGGRGDDVLYGGRGRDTLGGGPGHDVLHQR